MSLSLTGWGLVLFLALAIYALVLLFFLSICKAAARADADAARRLIALRERADRQRSDLEWADDMGRQWQQIRRLPTYINQPGGSE